MAKKKKDKIDEKNPFLDKAVERNDTLTIADVKQFITDCRKKRDDVWLNIADRSWSEIKKRNKKGKIYGGQDLDKAKRWAKFPLWWSCWKIRQPLTLARIPIPVIKDTQGDDPLGRTACIVGERLTRGILKTFDAFDEFSAANDDFLVTDFGWGRVFYRKEECPEEEKLRLQEVQPEMPEAIEGQPPPQPQQPIYITPDGEEVTEPLFDEFGPYIKTGEIIQIENEEVYFEAGLYSGFYTDGDARRWNKVTRIAFEYEYSYRDFKKKFGEAALDKLTQGDIEEHRTGKPIICFEYHDLILREVRWCAENSEDFFQPADMPELNPEQLEEVEEKGAEYDNSDLYGLSGFFPCTAPLIINSSTDEFWPSPEYLQVSELIDNIHNIVARMILLTKAIRCRFFFDSSIPQLASLIGETGEGGGLGIPNLTQALMNDKGKLASLVAFFPVDEMIQGLNNMYKAFEQGLNMFYQATGLSELLRGQTSDADKTFGERQLEGKFALNRIEPRQRKVQEWIRANYQLLMEMALKMFSDKSLDEYITPQTLDQEDRQRYLPALELLRNNKRNRFRMDFETDSTIAINQQWKKQQAVELANVLTKAMESTAKVAETQPELAGTELQVLKYLIGEFTDGKLFIDEIQDSIQKVVERVSQPKPEGAEFDKDRANFELDSAKFQFEQTKQTSLDQLEEMRIQSNERIEMTKVQQSAQLAAIESQLEQYKIGGEQQLKQLELQSDAEESRAQLEKEYQKISADIALAQQELSLKRDALMVELRKIADKKEVDEFQQLIDARILTFEEKLGAAQHELEKTKIMLDEKEKYMTEARLQAEHQVELNNQKFNSVHSLLDLALKKKELDIPTIEIKK